MNKQDLVNLVAAKTSLPPAMAAVAVETVIGYLQKQLPAPIAAQLSSLVDPGAGAAGASAGNLADLAKGLPGGLGGLGGLLK
ncbi:hypothetical protein LBMAG53_10480 [Planctomycetota bacterium]|nr:hypothetical protein LBMAG53_10480 [Planctomycetota bacterium]